MIQGFSGFFSLNKTAFCKYDQEGNCVDTIQVNIHRFKNQPFCVVDNDGVRAIFRSETHKALMIKDSCKKIFIDVSPFAVTCMCLTRDCEILAGLSNSKENYFGIAIYSLEGVRKQFITQVMKNGLENLFCRETVFVHISSKMSMAIFVYRLKQI